MSVGQRNDQLISRNEGDFLTRREFYSSGARLASAVLATHRAFDGVQGAGGMLMEGWLGDSRQIHGACASVWTENSITAAQYFATTNGGPYILLDGLADYLSMADFSLQEAGTEEIFAWRWVYSRYSALGNNASCLAKYNTGLNNCSWKLFFDVNTALFSWTTNAIGAVANDITLTAATYGTPADETWHFLAGYWKASTLMQIWVGQALDERLTSDTLIIGVPASVFNGNAALTCGATGTPGEYWDGRIGVGHTRFNVPSTNVDAYAARLFHLTRWFYQA